MCLHIYNFASFFITYLYVGTYFIFVCLLFGIVLWGPKGLEKAQIGGPFPIQMQADFQPTIAAHIMVYTGHARPSSPRLQDQA